MNIKLTSILAALIFIPLDKSNLPLSIAMAIAGGAATAALTAGLMSDTNTTRHNQAMGAVLLSLVGIAWTLAEPDPDLLTCLIRLVLCPILAYKMMKRVQDDEARERAEHQQHWQHQQERRDERFTKIGS